MEIKQLTTYPDKVLICGHNHKEIAAYAHLNALRQVRQLMLDTGGMSDYHGSWDIDPVGMGVAVSKLEIAIAVLEKGGCSGSPT